MTRLIHILTAGRALCGRRGAPVTWDSHESWVGETDARQATCSACVDAYCQLNRITLYEFKHPKGKR